jgi:uncharacterized protein YyaL (SSP411 family)
MKWNCNAALAAFLLGAALAAGAAGPPKGGNRLALESSPYLLQHAGNPVDWYPWGDEAIAKARAENKPILLSVGYSTCYWCHVMARESFNDPAVAGLLNRHFVSIKVDREERPDIDDLYMTAVQLLARSGGWPTTLLLTPELKPFFGGLYLSKPDLVQVLQRAHQLWTAERNRVQQQAAAVASEVERLRSMPKAVSAALPEAASFENAVAAYAKEFDARYGGFSEAPKFPRPVVLEMLLTHYEATGNASSLEMASRTLDAMSRGGIYDHVGGGFHRYSTDARWLVPHFEKMLYDNAQLLRMYARAWKLTGNADFRRVAADIASYLRREMLGPSGLFYSARDAEVDAEEGRFYVWTREELRRLLAKGEYALASRVYGFDGEPNFRGRYVLYWPIGYEETARRENLTLPALMQRLGPIRARLLRAREQRKPPYLDDKFITSWNAMTIEAFAYAGRVLGEKQYVGIARKAANALLARLRDREGRLLRVWRQGSAKLDAYLDDYAATALAMLELERATGEKRWRVHAAALADAMIEKLWDPAAGAFYYVAPSATHLFARAKDLYDDAIPSGNSLAVRALIELVRAGEPRYLPYAASTLRAYASVFKQAPRALPYMLAGLQDYRSYGLAENVPPPSLARLPDTADLVKVRARLEGAGLAPGRQAQLVVELQIAEGWHVNANPASLDFLIPTSIEVSMQGAQLAHSARYPDGKQIDARLGSGRIAVYSHGTSIPITLTPADLPADKPAKLDLAVRAQACNDRGRCLAPATIRAEVPVSLSNDVK